MFLLYLYTLLTDSNIFPYFSFFGFKLLVHTTFCVDEEQRLHILYVDSSKTRFYRESWMKRRIYFIFYIIDVSIWVTSLRSQQTPLQVIKKVYFLNIEKKNYDYPDYVVLKKVLYFFVQRFVIRF